MYTELEKDIGRDSLPRAKQIISNVLAKHGHILGTAETGLPKVTYNKNLSEVALKRTAEDKKYRDNLNKNKQTLDSFRNKELGVLTTKLKDTVNQNKIQNPITALGRDIEASADLDPKIVNKIFKEIRSLSEELKNAEDSGTINNPDTQVELDKMEAKIARLMNEAKQTTPNQDQINADIKARKDEIREEEGGEAVIKKFDDDMKDLEKDAC